jgi:diadenosine tetraphosphate (Ap4A) HIT family hydrolase
MVKLWTREEWDKITWWKILGKENCPFCNLEEERKNIIWEWKFWFIAHNIYPYSGNNQHIMAIPYRHILYSSDLNNEELLELHEIYKFVEWFFGDENYFSCTRETQNSRSIEHYHMHFIPWKLQWGYLMEMLEEQGFPVKV